MKIAIIGCGLIGMKRAKALGGHELVIVADLDEGRAKQVASVDGRRAIITNDWMIAAGHPEVDIVIISSTNDLLAQAGLYALSKGKHVLLEKPGARSAAELRPLISAASAANKKVKIGFNLRYHPALKKAKEMFSEGEIGDLMFIRGRYGHGGRVGYDKEWRADPKVSGGGELIDQGVHLIDLSRWFLGDFNIIEGFAHTYFWDMPVDDNSFLALRTEKEQMAWLHVSCSEWKNMFCYEIYGRTGKLQIDGIGGSYGMEKLTYYKMLPQMGPPDTSVFEYPGQDISWDNEFADFVSCIENDKELNGDLNDAMQALNIVDKIYRR